MVHDWILADCILELCDLSFLLISSLRQFSKVIDDATPLVSSTNVDNAQLLDLVPGPDDEAPDVLQDVEEVVREIGLVHQLQQLE